jgi:hypothetical protein
MVYMYSHMYTLIISDAFSFLLINSLLFNFATKLNDSITKLDFIYCFLNMF